MEKHRSSRAAVRLLRMAGETTRALTALKLERARSGEHGEDVDVGAVVAEQEMRPGQRRAAYLDLDSERADQSPRPGVAVA